ncbi:hypothetical protein Q5H91_15150 [Sphingomonas sp. KR1UV-12]|uniref:DUF5808 domain-containing protein n=1 Tax=Sphingomonas aurea TaxID=3063994 RepID=A0ABT9ENM8_9SPHN|nr:hypothetical protein [Sphingomonas sp. KR1UV-12]MDP1028559.1 hypothetical protein [Sphingomonas sp. KR1UV-12]
MRDDDAWFVPKRFGFGFRPANWRGWLATILYLAIVLTLANAPLRPDVLRGALIAIVTAGYLVLAAHHTRGGLAWRWGEKDR